MIYIYSKELKSKKIAEFNLDKSTFLEKIKDKEIDIDLSDKLYVELPLEFYCAIYKNNEIREATHKERVEVFNFDELYEGEKIENGKLINVKIPADILRPCWDKEKKIWIETITKEELMLKRKELIMQYKEIKTEIETLEEFSTEFESYDTIEMLKEQMEKLKQEINKYAEQIEQLKQ